MIQAVQMMAAISFFVLGFSCIFQATDWKNCMAEWERAGRTKALCIGSAILLIGSFIVAFHPVWNGFAIILTLIGYLAIIEGTLYLLFPQFFLFMARMGGNCPAIIIRILGLIAVIIAIILIV